MTIEVRVPQLPESVADATLVSWHKKPGDAVAFRILRRADNAWTSVYLAGTLPAEQH